MLKLIVFDWDDVFTAGSTEAYHTCYIQAAKDSGATVADSTITKVVDELWGRPYKNVIREFLKAEPELLTAVTEKYEAYIQTDLFLDKLSIVDGSLDMLVRLEKVYTLAIVSGIDHSLLTDRVFPKFNVPDVFKKIITNSDLADRSRGKPNPDMLNTVLEFLNIKPEESVLVGDAPNDMKMAMAAGVTPIAVLTGQLDIREAQDLQVPYILNSVSELEPLLSTFK